jgi:DNA-directed RNA polymerase specialized sigma24 family protein
MLSPEDLVENALVLLLVGGLKWRGSLDRMLSTLCRTIRNLSLHPQRFERKLESLDYDEVSTVRTTHDAGREAVRVLLCSDVAVALGQLSECQRSAVAGCWMNGETSKAVALADARPSSAVRTHLERAKPYLQTALGAYAPVEFVHRSAPLV